MVPSMLTSSTPVFAPRKVESFDARSETSTRECSDGEESCERFDSNGLQDLLPEPETQQIQPVWWAPTSNAPSFGQCCSVPPCHPTYVFMPMQPVFWVPSPTSYTYGVGPAQTRSSRGHGGEGFGPQKLLEAFNSGTESRVREGIAALRGRVVELSLQPHGTRVVQRALELATAEEQLDIASELRGFCVRLAQNMHGNHVLQRLCEVMPKSRLGFMCDELVSDIAGIATNEFGCRVLQRLIEHGAAHELQHAIVAVSANLLWDRFGHHVVEALLDACDSGPGGVLRQLLQASIGAIIEGRRQGCRYSCRVLDSLVRKDTEIAQAVGAAICEMPARLLQGLTSKDHGAALLISLLRSGTSLVGRILGKLEVVPLGGRQKRLTAEMRKARAQRAGCN